MTPFLKSWRGLRKLYVMAMTLHHKGLLTRHSDILFGSQACQRYGQFDKDKILSAKILLDVDVNYSSKRAGFKTCEDYYRWCSSRHFMDQVSLIVEVNILLYSDPYHWTRSTLHCWQLVGKTKVCSVCLSQRSCHHGCIVQYYEELLSSCL
jgi:hypothetical protein